MRIVEDEYNWKRESPVKVVLESGPQNITFERPLKIYRIRGEGEIHIYEDEEMTESIYSGTLPFEPDLPICVTSLMFLSEEARELSIISEIGVEKNILDPFLNIPDGMSDVSNSYSDDSTFSTLGLPEFKFNGLSASTIYISSNHWLGFGVNSEQLLIMRRDGCSTSIRRQEGTCGNGVKFLKIRFDGYTVYRERMDSNRLVFEFFLLSNQDMFLNLIKTPTSQNTGISKLVCGDKTVELSLADESGLGNGKMVSFYHLDDEGRDFRIIYDNYKGLDYFSYGFLIESEGKYYTLEENAWRELTIENPKASDFYEFGFEEIPRSDLLVALRSPKILYWKAGGEEEILKCKLKAYPYPKTISSRVDMSHPSILGLSMMTAQYSGDVRVKYSINNGDTFSDEIPMGDFLSHNIKELWDSLADHKVLLLQFVLHDNASLSRFKLSYIN